MWGELYENSKASVGIETLRSWPPITQANAFGDLVAFVGGTRVAPSEYVAWAKQKGFPIADKLLELAQRAPQTGTIQTPDAPIPGNTFRTSIGELAKKAAWQIEGITKRTASRDQVMQQLQDWADKGSEPDVLIRSDKPKHGVVWITRDGKERRYDIEACGKTLTIWNNSRAKKEPVSP